MSVSAAAQFAEQPKEEQAKQITKSATPADAVKAFRDSRQIRSAEAVGDDGPRVVHPNESRRRRTWSARLLASPNFAALTRGNGHRRHPARRGSSVHISTTVIREWLGQLVAALGGIKAPTSPPGGGTPARPRRRAASTTRTGRRGERPLGATSTYLQISTEEKKAADASAPGMELLVQIALNGRAYHLRGVTPRGASAPSSATSCCRRAPRRSRAAAGLASPASLTATRATGSA